MEKALCNAGLFLCTWAPKGRWSVKLTDAQRASREKIFPAQFINNDRRQLMLKLGHDMFMVIDIVTNLIIISFERRCSFEDRDFC